MATTTKRRSYFDAVFNSEEFIAVKVVAYVEKRLTSLAPGLLLKS